MPGNTTTCTEVGVSVILKRPASRLKQPVNHFSRFFFRVHLTSLTETRSPIVIIAKCGTSATFLLYLAPLGRILNPTTPFWPFSFTSNQPPQSPRTPLTATLLL
jgi:hypothetical protein